MSNGYFVDAKKVALALGGYLHLLQAPFSAAVSTENCPKALFQSGKAVWHMHNIGWCLCSGGREDYENQGDALITHCALNSLICILKN